MIHEEVTQLISRGKDKGTCLEIEYDMRTKSADVFSIRPKKGSWYMSEVALGTWQTMGSRYKDHLIHAEDEISLLL